MAYRAGPAVPGLPFPRKNLGAYIALAAIAGGLAFVIPTIFLFASDGGTRMFREGGWAMYALLFFGFVCATALSVLAAFVVRGREMPATLVAGLPAMTTILGAVLAAFSTTRLLGAVSGLSIDPAQMARLLAEGTAETDSISLFACLFGAAAFGATAVAHLGAASTVDRDRYAAPASAARLGSLLVGVGGILVAVALRVVFRATAPSLFLTIPSLIVVTVFACTASRNAALARGWHDRSEANAWVASILVAAIASAASVALLDVAGAIFEEKRALHAIASASSDPSQQMSILAHGLRAKRAALVCACVDGLFAFATPAVALAFALGRGPDGEPRSPLRAPVFVALGGVALALVTLFGTRAWAFSACATSVAAYSAVKPEVDLPAVPREARFDRGRGDGTVIFVRADGTTKPPSISAYSDNVVVVADRRAKWQDVATAIRLTIAQRKEAMFARHSSSEVTLSIRVRTNEVIDRSPLGDYAIFLGPDVFTVQVLLEPRTYPSPPPRRISPRPSDDMDSVIGMVVSRTSSGTASAMLLPPDGRW